MTETADPELEDLEIRLLLEAISIRYGYDFSDYAPASLKRRILKFVRAEGLSSVSALTDRALHSTDCFERFLLAVTVNVTAMFRDPDFYLAFRNKVAPELATYPFIRVWVAGCSTGEEVYSLAILMEEEGLLERCRIYATDVNEFVLRKARDGIFSLTFMKEYTANYIRAGGRRAFSDYYTAAYDSAAFRPSLAENVVFAQHNLVTNGSFNEFNAILCRNVMIYFNRSLQDRVHKLFYDSLCRFGVLGLGEKENVKLTPYEKDYEMVEEGVNLYRRRG
jgi:chemotaxis protein methyltransferase CheR